MRCVYFNHQTNTKVQDFFWYLHSLYVFIIHILYAVLLFIVVTGEGLTKAGLLQKKYGFYPGQLQQIFLMNEVEMKRVFFPSSSVFSTDHRSTFASHLLIITLRNV